MSFPKITELPDITESDSISLQAIISKMKTEDWKERYKSAVSNLLKIVSVSNNTLSTLRFIRNGIDESIPWYGKDEIEEKLGVKFLIDETAHRVEEAIAPAQPRDSAVKKTKPWNSWRKKHIPKKDIEDNIPPAPHGEEERDDDKPIVLIAPGPMISITLRKHEQSINNDIKSLTDVFLKDAYKKLLTFLKDDMSLKTWELPLYSEVTISRKSRVVQISASYWKRVKCNDQKREWIVQAFMEFTV